ncbi:NAD(P)/FAD-dependent oxidoreductase [Pseudonocardia ailaonensis]|uniref:Flavin-dependent monooxygenase n=1 Tax=Pseudonocardia ailaonensis TaxID=367279 RepID=A0ABN2NME6_9PSEU
MKIAVIGAGPGGLTLARVLQRHGIPVTVYERDDDPGARDQGGTLDMQQDTGQVALEAAGLLDDFLALSRPEGQGGRIADRSGRILADQPARPGDLASPEIDRGELRGLLLGSLEPGTVRWGSVLERAEPGRLHLRGGDTVEADLIVGADGAWSRVRPLVSPARPEYSGVTFVELRITDVDEAHPEIAALVGDGMLFALGDRKGLLCQRNGHGVVRVYAAFAAELGATHERADLYRIFEGWGAPLLRLLDECEPAVVDRPMFALPVPHTWEHVPGVTLLGDAAHLMSPFSGLGANTAMLDGADLALAIAEEPDLSAAVRRYERLMFPRAARNAEGAAEGLAGILEDDALEGSLAHVGRRSS